MQRRVPSNHPRGQPPQRGLVVEPFHLVLIALSFLVLGVLLGWFTHGYYSVSQQPAGGQGGAPAAGADAEQVRMLLDHVAQAESQLAARPGDLSQREQLGNLYYDLGEARARIGDAAGARQAFLRAIEQYEVVRQAGTATPDVLTDLGTMYYRSGQPGRAVKAFEEAVAKDPRHRNAWMNMGVVKRESLNDETGAREAWQRFLEISPAGPDAERVRTWLNQVSVPGG